MNYTSATKSLNQQAIKPILKGVSNSLNMSMIAGFNWSNNMKFAITTIGFTYWLSNIYIYI